MIALDSPRLLKLFIAQVLRWHKRWEKSWTTKTHDLLSRLPETVYLSGKMGRSEALIDAGLLTLPINEREVQILPSQGSKLGRQIHGIITGEGRSVLIAIDKMTQGIAGFHYTEGNRITLSAQDLIKISNLD